MPAGNAAYYTESKLSKGLYMVLEAFAAVFCKILLVTMVFGSIAQAADDEHTSYIGKVMVCPSRDQPLSDNSGFDFQIYK